MNEQIIKEIYALIPGAVLLPIIAGTKQPDIEKNWPAVTYAQTQTPEYQKRLADAAAVGVLQGAASGGLCSFDFDDPAMFEKFFTDNPHLKQTLITKGKRGGNVWFYFKGDLPPSHNIKGFCEVRADRRQTVIAGAHKDGGEYTHNKVAPIEIAYSEIKLPEGVANKNVSYVSYVSNKTPTRMLAMLATKDVVERVQGALGRPPELAELYEELVFLKIAAARGERNDATVAMMTFLHTAVTKSVAMTFAEWFYLDHRNLWHDSLEQHMKEARAHWAACEKNYPDKHKLTPDERKVYQMLTDIMRDLFRICRSLSQLPKEDRPLGCFNAPQNYTGYKLGLWGIEVTRMLKKFCATCGIIEMVTPGKIHSRGKDAAAMYRWLLSPPCPAAHTQADKGQSQPQTLPPAGDNDNGQTSILPETPKLPPCPYEDIRALFNNLLSPPMPQCKIIEGQRARHVKAAWLRWEIEPGAGLEGFKTLFEMAKDSPFLTGKTNNTFRCGFDWLVKPGNWTKVFEGNYNAK